MADAPTRKQRRGKPDDDAPAPARADVTALRLHRRGRTAGTVRLDVTRPFVVGRGASSDLCFDDDAVSRVHAHLKHGPSGWQFVDARSQNGSFVASLPTDDRVDDAARARLFATARPLRVDEALVLSPGQIVFLGDAHAALQPGAWPEAGAGDGADDPTTSSSRPWGVRGTRYAQELARAARGRAPVLLIGPSGAGKTWAARQIHDRGQHLSARRGRFVALNAAALPHDAAQLRSVLLGHKKGAFTGALHDHVGAWPAADGGTLFLDEIDSLPEAAQGFLLTLLEQSGDLGALGEAVSSAGVSTRHDVRVIGATKTSLAQAGLRADLAYRLVEGSLVEIPSLRDRRDDIAALVAGLCDELRHEDGAVVPFDDHAVAACVAADWPGEIRQLRSVVRQLCREATQDGRAAVYADDVHARLDAMARALGGPAPTGASSSSSPSSTPPRKPRQLTRDDIVAALAAVDGNMQRAADRLGVVRNTLVAKMDAFGIERPQRRT